LTVDLDREIILTAKLSRSMVVCSKSSVV